MRAQSMDKFEKWIDGEIDKWVGTYILSPTLEHPFWDAWCRPTALSGCFRGWFND